MQGALAEENRGESALCGQGVVGHESLGLRLACAAAAAPVQCGSAEITANCTCCLMKRNSSRSSMRALCHGCMAAWPHASSCARRTKQQHLFSVRHMYCDGRFGHEGEHCRGPAALCWHMVPQMVVARTVVAMAPMRPTVPPATAGQRHMSALQKPEYLRHVLACVHLMLSTASAAGLALQQRLHAHADATRSPIDV
jgi:hypothetical protein